MRLTSILTSALAVIGLGIFVADNLTPACIGLDHMSSTLTHQVSPNETSTTRFIIEQVERIKIAAILHCVLELKYNEGFMIMKNGHSDFFRDLSTDNRVIELVSVIEPHYSWMEERLAAFNGLKALRESIINEPSDCPVIPGGYFSRLLTVLRHHRITRKKLLERIESTTMHLRTLQRLHTYFAIVHRAMNHLKDSVCEYYLLEVLIWIQRLSDGTGKQSAEATELLDRADSEFYRLKILCLELERSRSLRSEVMDIMNGKDMTITESLKTLKSLEQEVNYAWKIDSWASRKHDRKLLGVVEREIEYFKDFFTDF